MTAPVAWQGFHLSMGGKPRVAMVPLADMINHAGGRAVNVNWDYDDSISAFVFRARRGIKQVAASARRPRRLASRRPPASRLPPSSALSSPSRVTAHRRASPNPCNRRVTAV